MRRTGNKYGAIKTVVDGITFDSRAEARRYATLRMLERAGEISDLECQPKYRIEVNGVLIQTYSADFRYKRHGRVIVEDVKSEPTAKKRDFRRTVKLMKAVHDIDVEVTT